MTFNRFFLPLLVSSAVRLSAALTDEIQVYTDDVNPAGKVGLEWHFNSTLKGRAVPNYAGEVTPHHGIRLTPEFSYGLGQGLEAGCYLPSERNAEGTIALAGAKVRLKWVPLVADEKLGGWFAGANVELSRLRPRFEQDGWSTELRTMVGYRDPDWLVAANPVLGWSLAGPGRGGRPDADIQLKVARGVAKGIAVGPEYYAGLGPLGRPPAFSAQDHSLFWTVDVDLKPWVFSFGLGRGISAAADRWTAKLIVELPL